MIFKDLLEKMENDSVVYADIVIKTTPSCNFRHKIFIAWASDFLEDKIWLDKEVVKIFNEPLDDYTSRLNVTLRE